LHGALALLERDPQLVIMDVRLPDGTALDVAEAATRRRPAPTMVVVSGNASPEESFRLAQAGVRAYLAKPLGMDDLVQAVEGALREGPALEPLVAAAVGHTSMRELQGDVRRVMVDQALALADGSRSGAARLLQVSRQAVQQIMRERHRDDGKTETAAPDADGTRSGPGTVP
jgi:DNA-binding NtrC family response regulator